MPETQRYVSRELTHFVGRSLCLDEERYEVLLKILREGCLKHPFSVTNLGPGVGGVRTTPSGNISDDTMFQGMVVCFCDIPVADLAIHMSKYGRIGLSFRKSFLVGKGANPVFYVAKDSRTLAESNVFKLRGCYFDDIIKRIVSLLSPLRPIVNQVSPLSLLEGKGELQLSKDEERSIEIGFFLKREMFSFIKCFDSSTPEDDPENYYMEREWRLYGNLHFELQDVCRVIFPEEYSQRFRRDMPDYYGQVTFAESGER